MSKEQKHFYLDIWEETEIVEGRIGASLQPQYFSSCLKPVDIQWVVYVTILVHASPHSN